MQCPNCQNSVPRSANVCGHCGHRLKGTIPQAPVSTPSRSSPKPASVQISPPVPMSPKKGTSGWVWGLGGALFVALIGGCIVVYFLLPGQPTTPMELTSPTLSPAPTQAQFFSAPTDEVAPTPVPTQESWQVVMDEDFSNPSALETAPDSKIEAGKLLMGGRFPQYLTTVQGDFRLSYDYQWSKINRGEYCRYDAGGSITTYSNKPGNSADYEHRLDFSILDQDKKFASGIYDNVKGEGYLIHDDLYAGSIDSSGVNHVQVEGHNSVVTLKVNGETLADDIEYLTVGFYHEIFLDSSGDNLGCKDVEVVIDNVVVEEYR